ncbi:MAG: glycosyltransferase family 2 protein [Candidatus Omnitrophica bacterium]|nr:glycosyltransferase family 2 protein [Candidatus Omnitrophota bacterium]
MHTHYSVVIPAYNEEEAIGGLYRSLKEVMDGAARPYEIIFVDDASTDSTRQLLEDISASDDAVRPVCFPENRGQSEAFAEGFRRAQGEIVISLDADLQNDPRDIPRLLEKLEEGYDVVCGWRRERKDSAGVRLLSKVANISRRIILGEKIHDVCCALRVYRSTVLKNLNLSDGMYFMLTGILLARGCRIGEVVVNHRPRETGESKFNLSVRLPMAALLFRYLLHKGRYVKTG